MSKIKTQNTLKLFYSTFMQTFIGRYKNTFFYEAKQILRLRFKNDIGTI